MQVFNNEYKSAQLWDLQGAIILFSTGAQSSDAEEKDKLLKNAFIVTGLQINFARPISKMYPINVAQAIYTVGAPEGTFRMDMLFGPGKTLKEFLTLFNDCASDDEGTPGPSIRVIPFGKSTCSGTTTKGKITVKNCLLNSIGIQVTGQNSVMPVYSSTSGQFNDMEVDD